jgi:hypothetical protein
MGEPLWSLTRGPVDNGSRGDPVEIGVLLDALEAL